MLHVVLGNLQYVTACRASQSAPCCDYLSSGLTHRLFIVEAGMHHTVCRSHDNHHSYNRTQPAAVCIAAALHQVTCRCVCRLLSRLCSSRGVRCPCQCWGTLTCWQVGGGGAGACSMQHAAALHIQLQCNAYCVAATSCRHGGVSLQAH
jgi:hypothetical protein